MFLTLLAGLPPIDPGALLIAAAKFPFQQRLEVFKCCSPLYKMIESKSPGDERANYLFTAGDIVRHPEEGTGFTPLIVVILLQDIECLSRMIYDRTSEKGFWVGLRTKKEDKELHPINVAECVLATHRYRNEEEFIKGSAALAWLDSIYYEPFPTCGLFLFSPGSWGQKEKKPQIQEMWVFWERFKQDLQRLKLIEELLETIKNCDFGEDRLDFFFNILKKNAENPFIAETMKVLSSIEANIEAKEERG